MTEPSLSGSVPLGQPPTTDPPQAAPPQRLILPHAMPQMAPQLSAVAQHPMCKVVDLPSGGIHYPCGTRQIRICPTNGEQEEMIGGTPEESPDRVSAIREVVRQCTDLGLLEFSEMTILDFGSVSMHLFALSAGTDEVMIQAGCSKASCPMAKKTLSLTTLPCVYLVPTPGAGGVDEPAPEEDPDVIAARMVEQAMGEAPADDGPIYRKVDPGKVTEPFTARLLEGKIAVTWRHLRMRDLEAAEEYARMTGDISVLTGAKLGTFLSARQLLSVNGRDYSLASEALVWWKKTASPILNELRKNMRTQDYGFNMRPEFRCPRADCRKNVRVKLPNDGSLFRSGD